MGEKYKKYDEMNNSPTLTGESDIYSFEYYKAGNKPVFGLLI